MSMNFVVFYWARGKLALIAIQEIRVSGGGGIIWCPFPLRHFGENGNNRLFRNIYLMVEENKII